MQKKKVILPTRNRRMSHFIRSSVNCQIITAKPANKCEYPLQSGAATSLELKVHACSSQMTRVAVSNSSCQSTVT
jgi:hypothetical protein